MPITLKGALTSGVFGAVDIVAGMYDVKGARTAPFKRYADWLRVAGVGGGMIIDRLGYKMGRMADIGAPLFYASLPLLEKSLVDMSGWTLRAPVVRTGGVRLGGSVSYSGMPKSPVAANGARAL